MRARLMMKLMGIIVLLILSVMGARSCSSSSPSSPLNPTNVLQNGVAGVCAEQQAEADAAGQSRAPNTVDSSAAIAQVEAGNPVGGKALAQALGGTGNLSCPTTTLDGSAGAGG